MKELSMLAAVSLLLMPPGLEAASPGRIQIATPFKNTLPSRQPWIVVPRGGSDDSDQDNSDEYDSEEMEEDILIEDDEDEYDDETEEEEDIVMVKSAVKASEKAKAKKTAAVKETVNAKLSAKKAKKPSLVKRYVPYIVRASLSPLTLLAMTKAYFASLFNLDYLAEDSSQDLRSALEEKAKKSGSAGGRKGKRMMKPGQAKTLSDLPQLNT
mmetsp:Transcript_19514/g.35387  ORF Transcript_19514/g.35387 Transcript_19514/m.35387 type:complete len:212 (-) Transcript_19514:1887-2522(-)